MDENIGNEATNELAPADICIPVDREENVVDRISTNMMGILGQIEYFVSSIQDDSHSLGSEHTASPSDVPSRLENALRLITMARDEVSAELNSNQLKCYQINKSDEDDDERKNFNENSGETLSENPSKLCSQIEIIKSLVDDGIKLRKVKVEMTRVMKMLSNRFQKIGAKMTSKSSSDAEEAFAGEIVPGVSGICSFAIEDLPDGQDSSDHEEELAKEHDSADLPSIDEVEQSIRIAAMNVSKIAENVMNVSQGIDKIAELVLLHESNATSEADLEEKENCEVREKGDFEETEKTDLTVSGEAREVGDDNGATVPEEEADSSCGESTTGDDTEAETTTDDESTHQTALISKNSNEVRTTMKNPVTVLNEYLLDNKVAFEYTLLEDDENPSSAARYNYKCQVLDIEAVGEGRSMRIAKLQVAVQMLSLIASHQEKGTLPPGLAPFSPEQLKCLEPFLDTEVETNAVIVLRRECRKRVEKMPCFKTLSQRGPNGEREITVQCTALNLTAIGSGSNKRRARREAAENIVAQYYKKEAD